MTDNTRTRFMVLFSASPENMDTVGDFIARRLSRRFGGATLLHSAESTALTGYWAEDGDQFKALYEGQVHKEPVISLTLSVLPEDEDEAYSLIKETLSTAAKKFRMNIRHVHVETVITTARHFDVGAMS
ncbi:hypothetical protein [Marinobacter sp. F3R11]|uniref:hypothetical protein n=1 Tax=Marinobacter sp. F3R11 TaxID=2267231 RepID=UPI000DEBB3B8|nr:hypothetical protein [Marinobacter sp. F3R11]RBW49973.1 hypothetical protein DS878_06555 [Marinobacter sp. F3R11]